MKRVTISVLLTVAMLWAPIAIHAEDVLWRVVAEGVADELGDGTLSFDIDPSLDPEEVVKQLLGTAEEPGSLRLTEGAQIDTLVVKDGKVEIVFSGADPGANVQAILPENVIVELGMAGPVAGGGLGNFALFGLGALGAGGLFGGLAGAGVFSSDDSGGALDGQTFLPPTIIIPPPSLVSPGAELGDSGRFDDGGTRFVEPPVRRPPWKR